MFFSGSSRIEDAVDCYQRAANLFKMAKNWNSAGSAFSEAAILHLRSGARHDAATNFVDAANCYKKQDINGKLYQYSVVGIILKFTDFSKMYKKYIIYVQFNKLFWSCTPRCKHIQLEC